MGPPWVHADDVFVRGGIGFLFLLTFDFFFVSKYFSRVILVECAKTKMKKIETKTTKHKKRKIQGVVGPRGFSRRVAVSGHGVAFLGGRGGGD